ncbi:hypothetical protein D3228_14110 [Leucobacter luti]|nr:hypothetical protein [Leucobacter luti]
MESARQDAGAEPVNAPIVFPECDSANPLAAAESTEFYESIDTDVSHLTGSTDLETFQRLTGPAAQLAMEQATNLRGCGWPLYLAGHRVEQYTSHLPSAAEEAFVGSLRDSDYVESAIGRTKVFTHVVDDPQRYRMTGSTTIQHMFFDGVWISIFETGKSDYSQSALDAVLALNPSLAP